MVLYQLTDKHFRPDRRFVHRKNGLIMYGVLWCGYCKRALPGFRQMAENVPKDLVIGYVDCDSKTCQRIVAACQVKSYPTFMLMRGGQLFPVDIPEGDRTMEGYLSHMCRENTWCPNK